MEELAGTAEEDNEPRSGGPRITSQDLLKLVTQTRGLLSGVIFGVNAQNAQSPNSEGHLNLNDKTQEQCNCLEQENDSESPTKQRRGSQDYW